MKYNIRLEEAAMFVFSIILFQTTNFEWWYFIALLLAPDISMLGYLISPKFGAFCYNLFHHKAIALFLLVFGWHFQQAWTELIGIVLFGHACLDRFFGFGLKYPDNFKHTHLGWMH